MEKLKKNMVLPMEIIDLNSDGNGVGKIDDFVIFVPMTAKGDKINVRIVKVLKNYGFGIVDSFITASPDRIEVDCPYFRQCGGCALRHISYESECQLKHKMVSDCFERIGGISCQVSPLVENLQVNHYRNKAQFPVTRKDGKAVAGFFANRSHRVVSCDNCLLQPEEFQPIVDCVLNFINEFQIPVYDELKHQGIVRNIYLRRGEVSGEIMVCLVLTKHFLHHQDILIQRLLDCNPQITSIIINCNKDKTNVILGKHCTTIYGKDTILDQLCGVPVELSPLSFYQVNHNQAERLYGIAKEYAGLSGGETVIDLYCGAGTIGLSMADQIGTLIGVEVVPEAVENAKKNAESMGLSNTRFLCGDASQAVQVLEREKIHPDVVLLDPPRKGCSQQVLDSVCHMAPERIVMISCNPATAARDCKMLDEKGYQVQKITPVDLFSRTLHIETVILLTKEC